MKPLLIALALAAGLATGCASDAGLRNDAKLALYRQHAGAPVDSFRYLGRITSWTPLGPESLAIWTAPSEAWLLEVYGPCSDLEFAQAIQLSASVGRVHARFDRVTPLGTGVGPVSCHIREIRPLDTRALKEARRSVSEGTGASDRSP